MDRSGYFSIPFVGNSSVIIKRLLSTLGSNVKVAFTNCNTNKQLFFSYTKDKTPLGQNSGVVYSIPCSACPANYVGETCQKLEVRLSQHKSDILKRNDHTALAVHACTTGHMFNFDDTRIIGREDIELKRKILEVMNILKHDVNINFKSDSAGLAGAYSTVIKRAYDSSSL